MRNTLRLSLSAALFCLLTAGPAHASVWLSDCFTSTATYEAVVSHEIDPSKNKAGQYTDISDTITGSGPAVTASCLCHGNVLNTSPIIETVYAGSPLQAGAAGARGKLTDSLDVSVTAYAESGGESLAIDNYPTPVGVSTMAWKNAPQFKEQDASVCAKNSSYPKRQFNLNTFSVRLFVNKPILGVEVIPHTLMVQYYTCISISSGSDGSSCATYFYHVSDVWMSGAVTAPLSCTINAGTTIEADLGSIVKSQFVTPGQPPAGYTLKNVDIHYHCDSSAVGSSDRIKLTLSADQGTVSGEPLIAKLIGRDDLGVRVFDSNNQNVPLDGTFEFPITLDEQGDGVVSIKAAPVSTQSAQPAAGQFEGNVTVKMDLK